MKFIRKILVKIIGLRAYLKLVSKTYLFFIKIGFLRKKYPELMYLYEIIHQDDFVIDIGANLGYYSKQVKRIIAKGQGQLLAVEPIPLFAEVWRSNVGESERIKLENAALGAEHQKVKMGIPIVDGVVRHGLTSVIDENNDHTNTKEFDVIMKIGDEVVNSWSSNRVDFIKCDVEGYEQYVIPHLKNTIEKHYPLFQIELGGKENKENVIRFLTNLGYHTYILNGKLIPIELKNMHQIDQDFYFVHPLKMERYGALIKNN